MNYYNEYRKLASEMIMAGVKAADPTQAVFDSVKVSGNKLRVRGQEFNLGEYDRILLFGVGKAVSPMAQALEQIITPDDGLLITKIGNEIGNSEVKSIPVYKAYHPEPKQENITYSDQILKRVSDLSPESPTLIFFLVTGGGSALFCDPPEGITIDDIFKLNQLLMRCGADINEINTIRKHVSRVKGGRFGKLCSEKGATVITLLLSDVVGDDLSVIASGPTFKDSTTFTDAINLAKQFKIWGELPESIKKHLLRGANDKNLESPRLVPDRVYNYLIGNNLGSLQTAAAIAREAGFNTTILSSQNAGEAKTIGKLVMGIAKEIQDSGNPISVPAALILGGEMVVTFNPDDNQGLGGPNREFVLGAAIEIAGRENIVVAGADTDGVDGRGKAGAIADSRSLGRTKLDARFYLDNHNTESYFDSLNDSIEFASYTNVNDINIVLIGPKSEGKINLIG